MDCGESSFPASADSAVEPGPSTEPESSTEPGPSTEPESSTEPGPSTEPEPSTEPRSRGERCTVVEGRGDISAPQVIEVEQISKSRAEVRLCTRNGEQISALRWQTSGDVQMVIR